MLTGVTISIAFVTIYLSSTQDQPELITKGPPPAFFTFDVLAIFAGLFFLMMITLPILMRKYINNKKK